MRIEKRQTYEHCISAEGWKRGTEKVVINVSGVIGIYHCTPNMSIYDYVQCSVTVREEFYPKCHANLCSLFLLTYHHGTGTPAMRLSSISHTRGPGSGRPRRLPPTTILPVSAISLCHRGPLSRNWWRGTLPISTSPTWRRSL